MKIGYDGKRAVSNMTGLGNYSRLVIEQVATEYPSTQLCVYTPDFRDNPRLENIRHLHNVEFRLPAPQGFQGSLWRSFGVTNNLAADGIDVYHGLSNELPLNIRESGVPSVVTVHDVIYRRIPSEYALPDRLLYDFKYGRSCRKATRIIAVSERTKNDIVEFYGIDPDKIDVIYQGCDSSFFRNIPADELEAVRTRYTLPARFILQVGTIESRKNLGLTVRALSALPPDVHLVAIGRSRRGYREAVERIASECGVADRLRFIDNLPFADLPAINRLAAAVAYPSRYEGFGIPVLEALAAGTPVVAAKGSCLEEAGGDAAAYVGPDDVRGMVGAVSSILTDEERRREMVGRGKRYAAKFNNADIAAAIMRTYGKAIEEFRI